MSKVKLDKEDAIADQKPPLHLPASVNVSDARCARSAKAR